MSFDELLESAGGFKNLFRAAWDSGVNVEDQLQTAMAVDSDLFRTVGYKVEKVEEGSAELSFPFSAAVARRGGMVHGGIVMYTLDNASGLAVMTVNPGVDQVTLELKVNFLEKLADGPFHVQGRVIRSGRAAVVAEGEVRDSKDVLCAKGIGTWMILNSSLQ